MFLKVRREPIIREVEVYGKFVCPMTIFQTRLTTKFGNSGWVLNSFESYTNVGLCPMVWEFWQFFWDTQSVAGQLVSIFNNPYLRHSKFSKPFEFTSSVMVHTEMTSRKQVKHRFLLHTSGF